VHTQPFMAVVVGLYIERCNTLHRSLSIKFATNCKFYLLLLALISFMCLSGCKYSNAPNKHNQQITTDDSCKPSVPEQEVAASPDITPAANQPKTIAIRAPGEIFTCDPWSAENNFIYPFVYEGLLQLKDGVIVGCLAETWGTDDGIVWDFTLRKGVKFSDGTLCDAEAVAASWDVAKERSPQVLFENKIESYEADGYELTVRLSGPCSWFERSLCGFELVPASKESLALYGLNYTGCAGTGPYLVSSFDVTDRVVLERNPHSTYENGADLPDKIEFVFALSDDHDLDAEIISPEQYSALPDKSSVYCFNEKDHAVLWLNPKHCPSLAVKEARKAVYLTIDLNGVNEKVFSGKGKTGGSIWAYHESDTETALEALASAGMAASDLNIKIAADADNANQLDVIRSQLLEMGMDANFDIIPPHAQLLLFRQPWHIGLTNTNCDKPWQIWTHTLKPEMLIQTCFQADYAPELYTRMCEIYDRMMSTPHWDETVECSRELTRIVQEDYAALPLVQEPVFFAVREGAEDEFRALTETSMFKWMYQ